MSDTPNKSDFDYSDKTSKDPNIKVPGADQGAESMLDQEHEDDAGNDRDLADKAARGAKEMNFQTGKLEPVADHVGPKAGEPDADAEPARTVHITPATGEADGPKDPHVGDAAQSATDDPKAPRSPRASKKD